jgi:hypothetical protein
VQQYCPLINETLDFRILEILLRDGRVSPADLGNAAMKYAIEADRYVIVQLLVDDARVDVTLNRTFAIRIACEVRATEIVGLLL